tara:strand:+ start:568 stop:1047 length:480 start_codon:yes stop_codon:yes gene_type:complete
MNIFVLDKDPKVCAIMHCDKHVVKMILESAQIICTTHHQCYNDKLNYYIPYKQTHINHPCSKWTRDSLANYLWLVELTKQLNNEYRYRYDKDINHKSYDAIKDLPLPKIPNIGMTRWARAMPDECKVDNDVISSYRKYYKDSKSHILNFKKRPKPDWLV